MLALKFTLLELSKTLSWIKWYKNIDLARNHILNKLMMFGSERKNNKILQFGGKRSSLKRIKGFGTREEGGGSRHSYAS